jgi:hypothetical protein
MKRSLNLCGMMFCCTLLFSTCDREEAPDVPFLTVDMTGTEEGKWIFATNEKGELLDIVRADLTNRTVRQFKTNKRYSSVDLSFVSIHRDLQTGTVYGYGTTYRNIPTTITVNAGSPPVTNTTGQTVLIGTAKITVNNYTGSRADVIVSTKRGIVSWDDVIVSGQQIVVSNDVFNNSHYVIISSWRDGIPVYYRQPLEAGNTTVEVDFNSFIPMENVLALSQSQTFDIAGLDASGSRMPVSFLWKHSNDGSAPVNIGTIPGFTRYLSSLRKPGQTYLRLGAAITASVNPEQKFIDYTLDVTDSNIKSFSLNFSSDYDYKVAYPFSEIGSVSLSWGVYASANDEARMLFDIPNEIISANPEFANYSIPEQGSVTIYKSLNGSYTYSDLLNEQLLFDYKNEFEQLIIAR